MKMKQSKYFGYLGALLVSLSVLTSDASAQNKKGSAQAKKPAGKSAQTGRTSTKQSASTQPARDRTSNTNRTNTNNSTNRTNNANSGNRNINNNSGNNTINNNNVNVDRSRGDVNINVDNSKDVHVNNVRNTTVRQNNYRPYTRPPYVYGGYHYRCYRPYYYHPYKPFYWGPVWHPWGFFVATLTATAIIVSFADADLPPAHWNGEYYVMSPAAPSYMNAYVSAGPAWFDEGMASPDVPKVLAAEEYYYDEGVFYLKGSGGYTVVAAPVGGIVKTIPSGYETVVLDDAGAAKNYYWGGTFYEKVSKGYKVVAPTAGALIEHMADGGEEVKMGDVTYVKLGETYYQPVQENGKPMYEVVNVEKAK
jgi:Family of unknown function (DUF6515)